MLVAEDMTVGFTQVFVDGHFKPGTVMTAVMVWILTVVVDASWHCTYLVEWVTSVIDGDACTDYRCQRV